MSKSTPPGPQGYKHRSKFNWSVTNLKDVPEDPITDLLVYAAIEQKLPAMELSPKHTVHDTPNMAFSKFVPALQNVLDGNVPADRIQIYLERYAGGLPMEDRRMLSKLTGDRVKFNFEALEKYCGDRKIEIGGEQVRILSVAKIKELKPEAKPKPKAKK